MNYFVEEFDILNFLRNSANISKFDKAFLDKLYSYIVDLAQEKKIVNKKETLEGVLHNILALIDREIEELSFRANDEFDIFEVEKIQLKIKELEVLRKRVILDNRVYLGKLLDEVDTSKTAERLLADSLNVLGRNSSTIVTPDVINNESVNNIFRRIYASMNLGESLDKIRILDEEEAHIAEDLHEDIDLNRIVRNCMVHFNVLERYFDRVIERIGYQADIRDLSGKHAELMKELRRAEKSIFKTERNRRKINSLNRRLDSLEVQIDQKKQLAVITKEQLSNTLQTLDRVGLSRISTVLQNAKFGYNREAQELFIAGSESKFRQDILGTDPMSIENLVYLIIDQVNRNFRVDDYNNVALLAVLNNEILERLTNTRRNLECNRAEKHMYEDKIARDFLSYLHKVGIENGKLVLYRDNLPKASRTSLLALFAIKMIGATKYSMNVEELPRDIQVEAELAKVDSWFREYTAKVYDDTMSRIEELENDKDYSINR